MAFSEPPAGHRLTRWCERGLEGGVYLSPGNLCFCRCSVAVRTAALTNKKTNPSVPWRV